MSGNEYEGQFKDDKKHGNGKIFKEEQIINLFIKEDSHIVYRDRNVYFGEFKNDKRHG